MARNGSRAWNLSRPMPKGNPSDDRTRPKPQQLSIMRMGRNRGGSAGVDLFD